MVVLERRFLIDRFQSEFSQIPLRASRGEQVCDPSPEDVLLPDVTGWLEITMCKPQKERKYFHFLKFVCFWILQKCALYILWADSRAKFPRSPRSQGLIKARVYEHLWVT